MTSFIKISRKVFKTLSDFRVWNLGIELSGLGLGIFDKPSQD